MRLLEFLGGGVDVSVATDRDAYAPGDLVRATVSVQAGRKILPVRRAWVDLLVKSSFEYRKRTWGEDADDYHRQTDEWTAATEPLYLGDAVDAHTAIQRAVELRVPEAVPPSCDGAIVDVSWAVVAVLDTGLLLRPSPNGTTPVRVLAPRSDVRERAARVVRGGGLELLPSAALISAGEQIAGRLVLRSQHPLSASELRVELVRREEVPRDLGHERDSVAARTTVAKKLELDPGDRRELSFRLTVPTAAAPSHTTKDYEVRWKLRAVVARRLRSDISIETDIVVVN